MNALEKKRLWIFLAIAYGLTAVTSVFLFRGFRMEMDLTHFITAQMTYPACGVILGKLFVRNGKERLPILGFVIMLLAMLAALSICIISVTFPEKAKETDWNSFLQYVIITASLLTYAAFWSCGEETREDAGIGRKNVMLSIGMIALFLVLYAARFFVGAFLRDMIGRTDYGNLKEWLSVLKSSFRMDYVMLLIINFFLTFLAFFGEEYGWRYYLQPIMQKKFGRRLGVILLGICWGVWHLDADFALYAKTMGPQYFAGRLITCVSVGVFFGYVYMKTQNVWALVIMHYLNNNLPAVFAGGGTGAAQNPTGAWEEIPVMILQGMVFMIFIFAPVYGKKKGEESNVILCAK